MEKQKLILNVEKTLKFFDTEPERREGHSTALVLFLGEELGIELLKDYCVRNNFVLDEVDRQCKTDAQRGPWLDAWLSIDFKNNGFENKKIYFQTEIKNWSSHAIGGKSLDIYIDKMHKVIKERRINNFFPHFLGADKVLCPMRKPKGVNDIDKNNTLPLACFWNVLHPDGNPDPFFYVDIKDMKGDKFKSQRDDLKRKRKKSYDDSRLKKTKFKRIYFFSMSEYLRNCLETDRTEFEFKNSRTIERLELIKDIIGY